jgi:hypothetical protein
LDVKQAFSKTSDGITFRGFDFTSQQHVPLRLFVVQKADTPAKRFILNVGDADSW